MHPRHITGPNHVHDRSGRQDFDNLSPIHPGALPVLFWCPSPDPALPFQQGRLIAFLVEHHAVRDRSEGGGEGGLEPIRPTARHSFLMQNPVHVARLDRPPILAVDSGPVHLLGTQNSMNRTPRFGMLTDHRDGLIQFP